jgi:acetyl-CoA synthetase
VAQVLQDHVRTRLAQHLYPRRISFVDEMPRTVTGKTRRDVLRTRVGSVGADDESA